MDDELRKSLTCTLCKDVKEHHCQIVYSQGNRVCTDCKKITQGADDRVFDSFMNRRLYR